MARNPLHIRPSSKEITEGRLSPQNIEGALYALNFDGLVVENVVNYNHLDTLKVAMVNDATYLASLGDSSPYNCHKG